MSSLLDQLVTAADKATGESTAVAAAGPAPTEPTEPIEITDLESIRLPAKPRARKTPAKPRAPRGKKPAPPTPVMSPTLAEEEILQPEPSRPNLGEDFESILTDKKPVVIQAEADASAPPRLAPLSTSKAQARRDQLINRLAEIEAEQGEEPSEEAQQELGMIFAELDEIEAGPPAMRGAGPDIFDGEPNDDDPAEREKLIASIGAFAAVAERDLPRGWQKKSSSELRCIQLQMKQEKHSRLVKGIVRKGYFSATAALEYFGPKATFLGEGGLQCQGLTEVLENDPLVIDALEQVSDELEETYKEYMGPWTLLLVATTAAVGKLHATNSSVRLAVKEVPPDLEARLRRIKPPTAAQPPPAPSPADQPAAPQTPASKPTGMSSYESFKKLGFT